MGVLFLKILVHVPYKTAPFKFLKYDTIKGNKLEFIHTICIFCRDSQRKSVLAPFLISYACIFRGADIKTSKKIKYSHF